MCGFTGKTKQLDGIIGLDPAGPIFDENSEIMRLNKGDAKVVQALHIDAGEFGISKAVGDVDIFVNTGKDQPYCPGFFLEAACSHLPFSLYFLTSVWEEAIKGNVCSARNKCLNATQAMVCFRKYPTIYTNETLNEDVFN